MGYEKCAHIYDFFNDKDNFDFFMHYGLKARNILDIGAGTGRIAIYLAQKGIKVVCVEPSPAMRKEFEKKLTASPEIAKIIKLIAADAVSFKIAQLFPAAFMSGCFDHLMDDNERTAALTNIHRHLKPGGIFVFDIFVGLMHDSELEPAGRVTLDNREYRRFVGSKFLDEKNMEVQLVFEILENDKIIEKIEEYSQVGVIGRPEIHDLLFKTGFKIREEFGNYDFTPYNEDDILLIIEAVRT